MSEEREGFLSRWSRKKRTDAEIAAEPIPAVQETVPEEPEFDISTLPDLESLTETSDALAFLQKGVPNDLKNAALRRIWSADVSIRDYIGPVEMGWDFNDPNGIPGFGPLSPDTDVAALLRQAIGEVEPKIEAENSDVSQVARAGEAEEMTPLSASDSPFSVEDGDAEAIPGKIAEAESSVPDHSAQAETVSFQGPRRHGGALPSF